jgi:hypothetical protein
MENNMTLNSSLEVYEPRKDERVHFKASSHIDLSFPDIKQHVIIESNKYDLSSSFSTKNNIFGGSMALSSAGKPPLKSKVSEVLKDTTQFKSNQ